MTTPPRATTPAAALAHAVGVDFEVSDGGETIPLPGFAVVTGFFSVVGIVIAAALLRWSARPAKLFARAAVTLTAISFRHLHGFTSMCTFRYCAVHGTWVSTI